MEGKVFVWRYSSIFLVGWEDGNLHWHAFERAGLLPCSAWRCMGAGSFSLLPVPGKIHGGVPFYDRRNEAPQRRWWCKSVPLTVFYGEMENVARGYNVVMTGHACLLPPKNNMFPLERPSTRAAGRSSTHHPSMQSIQTAYPPARHCIVKSCRLVVAIQFKMRVSNE